jgi:glycosyltransferase involved in cell wall biosynthesis
MVPAGFAIPGDIATLTGGYRYDRRVMQVLREAGRRIDHIQLPSSFPFPSAGDIAASVELLDQYDRTAPLVVDGLAFGALPHDQVKMLGGGIIGLCHHPLGLESGLDPDRARWLLDNEMRNLRIAAHVIVSSATTAQTLVADFDMPADHITIAEPGTDPMPRSGGGQSDRVELLAVGSLIERKGYDVLLQALSDLSGIPWRLRIAGSKDRSAATAAKLAAQVGSCGLSESVELLGELPASELATLYAATDVFVLSSLYEGYGMVLAEAMASGLAIVSTTGGAAAETTPDDAALKVPPGDSAALREALHMAIADRELRLRLAEASWRAGQKLPRWTDTADTIASVLDRVAGGIAR